MLTSNRWVLLFCAVQKGIFEVIQSVVCTKSKHSATSYRVDRALDGLKRHRSDQNPTPSYSGLPSPDDHDVETPIEAQGRRANEYKQALQSRINGLRLSIQGWGILMERDKHWPEAYEQARKAREREIGELETLEKEYRRLINADG